MTEQQPTRPPPQSQLPPGVPRGMWDYAHSDAVAEDYDDYFAYNRLFELDEQVLADHFQLNAEGQPTVVADLGCGTGRALVPLVRRGFHGLAVDLSEKMLDVVQRKAAEEDLPIQCVQGNLVELDCVAEGSVDHAMCLFSTLGMIRGRDNRRQALEHVRRILKPDGVFVLHVHNYWYNLYDPGGPWWLIKNYLRSLFDRNLEAGDKFFPYRGVPNMFLHVFSLGELRRSLRRGGFRVEKLIPLDPQRYRALKWPWLFGRLRANGWIVVCKANHP